MTVVGATTTMNSAVTNSNILTHSNDHLGSNNRSKSPRKLQPYLYLPVQQDNQNHQPGQTPGLTIVKQRQEINADMLIHSFRPFLAELLNMISYTQLRVAEREQLSNNDLLYNVLSKVSKSLQLLIAPSRLE